MTSVAIIGAGPAGCMCACNLDKSFEVTIFDKSSPLKTLLPTGGGKCNLAYAEFDFKELAKNYPRGEKFLYSGFSRFGTQETLDFFKKIGVKTYEREDKHIFPTSNSSQEVRQALLNQLKHCKIRVENILDIKKLDKGFEVKSEKGSYYFDMVVISIGGKSGYSILKNLNHTFEPPCPALVGLKTEPNFKELQGVTIKNCKIKSDKLEFIGDILFTDNGITGPAVFNLSSINARKQLPYQISVDFLNTEIDWQSVFDTNPKKNLANVLNEYLPKSFVNSFLEKYSINPEQKCCTVRSNTKELLNKNLKDMKFDITATRKDGEIVTCGGVNLKEINSKTYESKLIPDLYFCGEVLNIDGFCGGFNLQNCWTSGFLCADTINSKAY